MKLYFAGLSLLILVACSNGDHTPASKDSDGHVQAAAEPEKGPNRGRLLRDGEFAVEVTIFETGVPPEFHLYATQAGQPITPSDVQLSIELSRLDGSVDKFSFQPEKNYLKGSARVVEPHSFDVKVTADYAGKQHVWSYASYEGRTTIAPDMAMAAGIKTSIANAGSIQENISLYGVIAPNAERVRTVVARFPGPIRSVAKQIGDSVKAGETLAVVESNESLQNYAVTAPISGVITQRNANSGEAASSAPLFVIADFGSVWAELSVFARDRSTIRIGQLVQISAVEGKQLSRGVIRSISPIGSAGNQQVIARVQLENPDRQWLPGAFVSASVTVSEREAALVVANSALQAFRDFTVVFAQVGNTYEVRMLELGDSDGVVTEVLDGLKPGTRYVTSNSYLIKADIEKSGASHDH
ncbi:MAG: efflux RND transporter periplasmic adaptor subunit [Paraperlucidibaca sp.]